MIYPCHSLSCGGKQDVKELVFIPHLHANDGFDANFLAVLHKVPGIAGGIDVGKRQRGHATFYCRIHEPARGESSVSKGEICFTVEVHLGKTTKYFSKAKKFSSFAIS